MCIIIHRPAENALQTETLENCAKANKDGWGIMLLTENGIARHQGMAFEEFLDVYEHLPKDVEMGIHFRIRTHGLVNVANTHPFPVLQKETDGRDLFLMHNGIINIKTPNKDFSDTWHWVELVLKPILQQTPDLIYLPSFKFLVEQSVDTSRLLLLDENGMFIKLNEDAWRKNYSHKDNCEYSTTVPTKPYVWQNPKGDRSNGKNGNHYQQVGNPTGFLTSTNGNTSGGTVGKTVTTVENGVTTIVHSTKIEDTVGGETENDGTRFLGTDIPSGDTTLLQSPSSTDTEKTSNVSDVKKEPVQSGGVTDVMSRFPGQVLEDVTESQLLEMERQEFFDYGIKFDDKLPFGIEFDAGRTHLLQTDTHACEEYLAFPATILAGKSFDEIKSFVSLNKEEVALFLYWNHT